MARKKKPSFWKRWWKTMSLGIASLAVGFTTFWGATEIVLPLARSDAPPWAATDRIEMLAQNFEQLQQTQSQLDSNVAKTNETLDWTIHGLLQAELDRMQREGEPLVRQREVIDKLNQIRARLQLTPIARP